MRRSLACLILAFALCSPAFGADVARLLSSPDDAELLAAGSEAVLERLERKDAGLPEVSDEREAFLSVDGGRTRPLRARPRRSVPLRLLIGRFNE